MKSIEHEVAQGAVRDEQMEAASPRLTFVRRLFDSFSHRSIDYDLLEQFVGQLKSELALARKGAIDTEDACEATCQMVEQELSDIEKDDSLERNWRRANHAQKLIVSMYSEKKVSLEIELWLKRSINAKTSLAGFFLTQHEKVFGKDSDSPSGIEKKDLLMSIVDSMQRRRSTQHIRMRYARLAIYRVGIVFVISFAMFLTILTFMHWTNIEIEQISVETATTERPSP